MGYPTAVQSFTTKQDGVSYPQAVDINGLQTEVTAMETALLSSGLAHNLVPDATANARTLGAIAQSWGAAYVASVTFKAATTLTIAGGIVTATQGYHAIDTEGAAATDDLDTITLSAALTEGSVLVLRGANSARVPTLKDGTGNLLLNGDCALSATDRTIALLYDGTNLREIARSAPLGGSRLLDADDTQASNGTTVETALRTVTVPLNTLSANGTTLRFTAEGTLAANGNTKTVRVRWGGASGTVAGTYSQNTSSLVFFKVDVTIARIGSNSQRLSGTVTFFSTGSGAAQHGITLTTDTQTDTAPIDLVLTGQSGSASNDITYECSRTQLSTVLA